MINDFLKLVRSEGTLKWLACFTEFIRLLSLLIVSERISGTPAAAHDRYLATCSFGEISVQRFRSLIDGVLQIQSRIAAQPELEHTRCYINMI